MLSEKGVSNYIIPDNQSCIWFSWFSSQTLFVSFCETDAVSLYQTKKKMTFLFHHTVKEMCQTDAIHNYQSLFLQTEQFRLVVFCHIL